MSENRQNLEQQLEENTISCDEMDEANGWKSGTSAQHQRNHMGDFEMSSNPKCVLCIDPMRKQYEVSLSNGEITTEELSVALGTSKQQIQRHMKHHLQPLVQRSAANIIAKKELNEIDIITSNIQKLDHRLEQVFAEDDLDPKMIDALTKLASFTLNMRLRRKPVVSMPRVFQLSLIQQAIGNSLGNATSDALLQVYCEEPPTSLWRRDAVDALTGVTLDRSVAHLARVNLAASSGYADKTLVAIDQMLAARFTQRLPLGGRITQLRALLINQVHTADMTVRADTINAQPDTVHVGFGQVLIPEFFVSHEHS